MDVFEAIGDPTRRRIIELVAASPLAAGDIARQFPISRPAVSQHLTALAECGLLRVHVHGRSRIYSLDEHALAQPRDWLAEQQHRWSSALDRLEEEMRREEDDSHD